MVQPGICPIIDVRIFEEESEILLLLLLLGLGLRGVENNTCFIAKLRRIQKYTPSLVVALAVDNLISFLLLDSALDDRLSFF